MLVFFTLHVKTKEEKKRMNKRKGKWTKGEGGRKKKEKQGEKLEKKTKRETRKIQTLQMEAVVSIFSAALTKARGLCSASKSVSPTILFSTIIINKRKTN
jgi:hypothetical protein